MYLKKIDTKNTNINGEVIFTFSKKNKCFAFLCINKTHDFKEINIGILEEYHDINTYNHYIVLDSLLFSQLSEGDILKLDYEKSLFLLFKMESKENVLFLTEKCNNSCLFCSQPPVNNNDLDYFYKINTLLIKLMPEDLREIGITGGEPTLQKDKLILLISALKLKNPNIYIHLLTNGRLFKDFTFTTKFKEINKNLTFGIPLHSDYYADHDNITKQKSSYYETLLGTYNLARINSSIEIRIVVNKLNYKRLPKLSDYIFKNMPFVTHIAFMGVEYYGYAENNFTKLWIDPFDYKEELATAVLNLDSWNMNVSIYNIPYCLLKPDTYTFLRKSISSWKVVYDEVCADCTMKNSCCGLFGTSSKQSKSINALNI